MTKLFITTMTCAVLGLGAIGVEMLVGAQAQGMGYGLHPRATDHPWHNGHSAGYYQLRRECWFDLECREEIYDYFHVMDV